MGVVTNLGRAVRGADFFKNRLSIWLALGRGETPWPDENNPPEEDKTATNVEEIIGLKLISTVALVVEDNVNGTIIFEDNKYRILTIKEGYSEQATNLLVKFIVEPDEFPDQNYRQLGIYVDAIPGDGFHHFSALTSDKFQTLGQLVFLSNEIVQIRYPNTRNHYHFVLPQ